MALAIAHTPENPFLALTGVPLLPPHRPALLSTALYPTLVASPAWLARSALVQTLGDPGSASGAGASHRVVREAYGSTGCVNAMAWEDVATDARLATGGDDTKICIWSSGLDPALDADGRNATSPVPGYGLAETIATGHRSNIFSIKWAPGLRTRLFSGAADHQVRVYDLSLATNQRLNPTLVSLPSNSPYRPWTHHEEGTACIHTLRCHTGRVKRIATEASSDVFLTCAEDGTVRQHDLRTHHVCRRNPFDSGDQASCPPPLVSYGRSMSLYSLSISMLRPHLFVVAGTSPYAYLHDRRMLGASMQRDWHLPPSALPSPSADAPLTQCVRRFGLLDDDDDAHPHAHIVAAKLSHTRPRDLLLSYSAKGVYLFDTDGETVRRQDSASRKRRSLATTAERGGDGKAEERAEESEDEDAAADRDREEAPSPVRRVKQARTEGPVPQPHDAVVELPSAGEPPTRTREPPAHALQEGVRTSCPAEGTGERFDRVGTAERDSEEGGSPSTEGVDVHPDEGELDAEDDDDDGHNGDTTGDEDDTDSDTDLHVHEGPLSRGPRYHENVPLVSPVKHYTGHANDQTIKDVNFLTPDLVISGSDDGNFFVWDRDTEDIKAIFKGDDDVVNVMQPHPRLPLLAISGIDSTPRLFGPTTDPETAARANLVRDADRIRSRNVSAETERRSAFGLDGIDADQLLRLLFAGGAAAALSGAEAGEEQEGAAETGTNAAGEGATAPRRPRPPRQAVRLVVRGAGQDGEDAPVDCVVS